MLWRAIQSGLSDETMVVFADTGRERPETYEFVRQCSARFNVPIAWVWRRGKGDTDEGVAGPPSPFSRLLRDKAEGQRLRGEPFSLPGPVSRYCSIELKRAPAERFMHNEGAGRGLAWPRELKGSTRRYWTRMGREVPLLLEVEYTQVLGIRVDEPRRVARLRGQGGESRPVYRDGGEPWTFASPDEAEAIGRVRYDYHLPLVDAGVTEEEVLEFFAGKSYREDFEEWRITGRRPCRPLPQGFDLQLLPERGNCDACFEKSTWKRIACLQANPEDGIKWVLDESAYGTKYRQSGKGYAYDMDIARRRLPLVRNEDSPGECLCTD